MSRSESVRKAQEQLIIDEIRHQLCIPRLLSDDSIRSAYKGSWAWWGIEFHLAWRPLRNAVIDEIERLLVGFVRMLTKAVNYVSQRLGA